MCALFGWLDYKGIVSDKLPKKLTQALANAAEELKKITKMKYQKVEGSRLIARHLKLDGSSSSARVVRRCG